MKPGRRYRWLDSLDPRSRLALKGAVTGLLASGTAGMLGLYLPWRLSRATPLFYLALGVAAMLGQPAVRRAWWLFLGALVTCSTLVAFTPLAPRLLNSTVVDDGAAPADVIVVLSAGTQSRGLTNASQDRFLHGLRLLRRGVAPRIVFTGGDREAGNRFDEMARGLATELGTDPTRLVRFEPVHQSVMTTRGEALSVAAMAQAYGWRRVLLVTSPAHTRRARAAFRRVGLDAFVTPCEATAYDRHGRPGPGERLRMFQELVYEIAARGLYARRGWLQE